ncbi:MAG: class I SAM-dependent methyltransferase [Burkholderiales bacterium]|nr:class I SAM-dependent methyltransferase [Burkholderiales bacterium]
MKLTPQDLTQITERTLDQYQHSAQDFWEGTRHHDVAQNIQALLQAIQAEPPFTILDFGCGPGRDLRTFAKAGHTAIGLDGTASFATMASEHSGCTVWHQNFLKLALPAQYFDGVFANASLFHVPSQELPRVLGQLHDTLKPGGVLFSSNPMGKNQEGWSGQRYGVYHDLPAWREFMAGAGFVEVTHYYRPAGLPRDQQHWLATVWRRPE